MAEREKEGREHGDTPYPGRRTASPCTPAEELAFIIFEEVKL